MKKCKQHKNRWMLAGALAVLGAAAAAGAYWKKKQDEPYPWNACSCGKEPDYPEHMAAPAGTCLCDDGEDED